MYINFFIKLDDEDTCYKWWLYTSKIYYWILACFNYVHPYDFTITWWRESLRSSFSKLVVYLGHFLNQILTSTFPADTNCDDELDHSLSDPNFLIGMERVEVMEVTWYMWWNAFAKCQNSLYVKRLYSIINPTTFIFIINV